MKKVLSVILILCLSVNISFCDFDPYADEEVEKKSYKKLYYGIALTLLGGFLTYDGFSTEKVDVSKPKVDYISVSHSEYAQRPTAIYEMRSGISLNNVEPPDARQSEYTWYEIKDKDAEPGTGDLYKQIQPNVLYNTGNVDLHNVTIEVRYRYNDGTYMGQNGEHITKGGVDVNTHKHVENEGYHIAETNHDRDSTKTEYVKTMVYKDLTLKKGESLTWQDVWGYTTAITDTPSGTERTPYLNKIDEQGVRHYKDGTEGLNLGSSSPILMDIRIKLEKNKQYKPIYETRHKSDLEGVAGLLIGMTGIYFIVDHFLDMHKFNAYAKRHHLNLKVTTASNEYKLMLQKRI